MTTLSLTPCALVAALTLSSLAPAAEKAKPRKPLPSAEVIAKLPKDGGKEFNRLIFSQSPYLLQHARNPVDWYPWSKEALAAAKEQKKLIFLSVGYTTCHWCHVMEHECFEDPEVAKLLNESFIPIKVDREERPDIDQLYMEYAKGTNRGKGGWPLNAVMTPDQSPFFARGAHIPKATLLKMLESMVRAWKQSPENLADFARKNAETLGDIDAPGKELPADILSTTYQQIAQSYDAANPGFQKRPKFPAAREILFLLRYAKRTGDPKALEMAEKTLLAMRHGGIFDQVGYGFHRYTIDESWLTPHFEKMLYDQALLTMAYVEGYQATGRAEFAQTARDVLTYVLRDMTSPEGAFYSAEDADSEGEEGLFYLWTTKELTKVLGEDDALFFSRLFNCQAGGNYRDEVTNRFTGKNIPHLRAAIPAKDLKKVESIRTKLLEARAKRPRPQRDDKILTDWNGLMISALARAGQALEEPAYTAAAKRAAGFVLSHLRNQKSGFLHKRSRHGNAGLTAHLEDYAFVVWGLLDLYEATFETKYLAEALGLHEIMTTQFKDAKNGGFFMTAENADLVARPKYIASNSYPSGNSVALLNLARLYRITAKKSYKEEAAGLLKAFSTQIARQPISYPFAMAGLDFLKGPSHEIVISGKLGAKDTTAMISALRKLYLPSKVLLLRDSENPDALAKLSPYTKPQAPEDNLATAYVCQEFSCLLPTTEIKQMVKSLTKPPAVKGND